MANDLVVRLGARLDDFAAALNQAGNMADNTISDIEQKFSNLNPSFGGFAAIGLSAGGAIAAITGLLTALKGVNAELTAIGQAAKYLNTTTDEVQKLQFVGSSQGIGDGQALQDLQNVGRLLNDANVNENSLTKLLSANNIAYKDRAGNLISINTLLGKGADLVKNAGSYADKVEIAKLLGLTQQWIPALEQGAQGFKKIADSATDAGAVIDKRTIAKATEFDAAWKRSSAQLSAQFKSATADAAGFLDDLINKANEYVERKNASGSTGPDLRGGQLKFDAIADESQVASNAAFGLAQNLEQVVRVLDYLKAKGADPGIIAGIEELRQKTQAAAVELQRAAEAQSRLNFPNGVPVPSARPAAADAKGDPTKIPGRDNANDAYDRAQDQIKKRTADLEAETKAVGENAGAKAQAKAQADLDSAAARAKITLTDEQKAKNLELAQSEGVAAQALADRNQKLQENNALLQFAGNQTISILDGLRTGSLTAAQAVTQLTNSLITALEQAVLLGQGPLAGLLGSAAQAGTGVTGGIFGSLFGIGHNAGGTDNWRGGPTWVGENGPEIINLPRGAQVVPNAVARSGGGGTTFAPVYQIDAAGADSGTVARIQQVLSAHAKAIGAQSSAITSAQYLQSTGVSRG
jgi:hypothetical protein